MNIHYGVHGGHVFALMRTANRQFREQAAGLAVRVEVQNPVFRETPVYRVAEEDWGAFQEAVLAAYPGSTFDVRHEVPPWMREAIASLR